MNHTERLTHTNASNGMAVPRKLSYAINMDNTEFAYLEEIVKKLAYYENLEEKGLLTTLPCKIGDTVWCITSDQYDFIMEPIECIVNGIGMNIDNPNILTFYIDSKNSTDGWTTTFPNAKIPNHMNIRYSEDFGKSVFLTRECADHQLKKIERISSK